MTAKLFLLTGGLGSGKTTLCEQLAILLKSKGNLVAGLISPARIEQKKKTGIKALNVQSSEVRLLACKGTKEIDGLAFGDWVFDPTVFEWGNTILTHSTGADVLFIDEIGPLEFEFHNGWIKALDILSCRNFRLCITVVRPEYTAIAKKLWDVTEVFNVPNQSRHLFLKMSSM